ncbi:hypothetical protein WJX73_001330 [Symbiochloris irregularis]|uniref:AP2/ERF domain-containing protein n=1 Tax=Symbiochloris irregularis TaxID=706552 RepID=A0AAW1NP19_9CHLO
MDEGGADSNPASSQLAGVSRKRRAVPASSSLHSEITAQSPYAPVGGHPPAFGPAAGQQALSQDIHYFQGAAPNHLNQARRSSPMAAQGGLARNIWAQGPQPSQASMGGSCGGTSVDMSQGFGSALRRRTRSIAASPSPADAGRASRRAQKQRKIYKPRIPGQGNKPKHGYTYSTWAKKWQLQLTLQGKEYRTRYDTELECAQRAWELWKESEGYDGPEVPLELSDPADQGDDGEEDESDTNEEQPQASQNVGPDAMHAANPQVPDPSHVYPLASQPQPAANAMPALRAPSPPAPTRLTTIPMTAVSHAQLVTSMMSAALLPSWPPSEVTPTSLAYPSSTATGQIQFIKDGVHYRTASLSSGRTSVAHDIRPGTYRICTRYTGDTHFSPSQTEAEYCIPG